MQTKTVAVITVVGILLGIVACSKPTTVAPSPTTVAAEFSQVAEIKQANSLIAGNVGSTTLILVIDGNEVEQIKAGNEVEHVLAVGYYDVGFLTLDRAWLVDCHYASLQIKAANPTGAYCAE